MRFLHGLWIHNEQGHSRQCPSLRCLKHYMTFFFSSFQMCVLTLSIYFILCFFFFLFPQHQTREAGFCGQRSKCVLTAVNEGIYWSFIKLVVEMPYFWAGVDWRRPLSFTLPILKNLLVQLWPQLTSAFSHILGERCKDHMQTGNHRLALGLLQTEKPTLPQLNLF